MGCKSSKPSGTKSSSAPLTPQDTALIAQTAKVTVSASGLRNTLTQIQQQHKPAYTNGMTLSQDSGVSGMIAELKNLNYAKLKESMGTTKGVFDPNELIRVASDSAVLQEVTGVANTVVTDCASAPSGTPSARPPTREAPGGSGAAPQNADGDNAMDFDEEGNRIVLPKGDWVKAEGTPYYYSEAENLYYHPPSCQFYDPTNEMWYDPEKDEWYKDDEDDA